MTVNLNSETPAPPSGLTNIGVQAGALPSTLAIAAVTSHSGNCELTFSVAHNCVTGDAAFINSASFPALQGAWTLTVIDATHLVLNSSIYQPGYPGGATFLAFQDFSFYMPDMVGDDVGSPPTSGGISGAVPAPPAGSAVAGKYLKADGTWEVPAGSGSLTKYPFSFSSATSVVVSHALGTLAVVVALWDPSGEQLFAQKCVLTNTNTVTLTFGSAQSGTGVVIG